MDFRAYAEQKRKEAHKEIIFDICMEINNCANCHNDETRKTECCPLNRVELHKVSANSFYMIPYENSETNRNLIEIAEDHGYKAGFVIEDGETFIKFWMKTMDIDYWYIGYICKILDNSQVNYHHCYTWFRLFLKDGIYSITAVKHNNVNEVVVYKGEIINTKAPIVFQGALQDFENWLHDNQ